MHRWIAVLLSTAAMVLALPAPATAQTPDEEDQVPATGGWAVEPGGPDGPGERPSFTYNLSPGQSIRDTVSISNTTDEEIVLDVYAKDAYNTPIDAGFALLEDEEPAVDVGTWITLGTEQYTLAPGRRVDIPFELTVPANASPGDHAGGIIAANAAPIQAFDEDGVGVAVRHRVAARVYVRVDGPANAALWVSRIDNDISMPIVPWLTGRGDAQVLYEVTNTGNIRLESTATMRVTGVLGRTVRSFPPRDLPELLPGSSIVVTENWSGLPPIEPLNVSVTVESTDGEVVTSGSTRVFVWSWAAVAVLAVLLALVVRWWRRRSRRRRGLPPSRLKAWKERRRVPDAAPSPASEAQPEADEESEPDEELAPAPVRSESESDTDEESDVEPDPASDEEPVAGLEPESEPAAREDAR